MRRTLFIGLAIVVVGAAHYAAASDGCIEISKVNVAWAGTLDQDACYVLTSSVTQGLTVTGGKVTLDLNGFKVSGGSSPAITLSGELSNIEIRNGTLLSSGAAVIDGTAVDGGYNHVFRDLRIGGYTTTHGIHYQLSGSTMKNLRIQDSAINVGNIGIHIEVTAGASLINPTIQNVAIQCDNYGVRIDGISGDVVVRNPVFRHLTIDSGQGSGIIVFRSGASSMHVDGFSLEDSSIAGGGYAVLLRGWYPGAPPESFRFEGSIHSCDLVSNHGNDLGVVHFMATQGALHCTDNSLINRNFSNPDALAFEAPGDAKIVIRGNTSSISHVGGAPIAYNVVSPPIGHDGTDYIYSNYDSNSGAY